MTEEEARQSIVSALVAQFEEGKSNVYLDWHDIAKAREIPEDLARRATAQLRAEGSVKPWGSALLQLTNEGYRRHCMAPTLPASPSHLDLRFLKYPQQFHELCRDLLSAELPGFQSFEGSGGDEGMDGFDRDSGTLFQFHMPQRALKKEKVAKYIEQASLHPIKQWVLVTTQDPTVTLARWIDSVKGQYPFDIKLWGPARVYALLGKHREVAVRYFGSGSVPASGAINVAAQRAHQIVNVVGPTVIRSPKATVRKAPIPGTVGADPYMKGELAKLTERLAKFRIWEKGEDKKKSIYPAIYQNYLREKGCRVDDTPVGRFEDAVSYFRQKIDNTKLGRINKGKRQPNY